MPKWISVFQRPPTDHKLYFVKCDRERLCLRLNEFSRYIDSCETFYWLDESEEEREKLEIISKIETIEDYAKTDYHILAEIFTAPYIPYIPKSLVLNTFHKHYLRIIGKLRSELGYLTKQLKAQDNGEYFKPKNNHYAVPQDDDLISKIKELNNSYF